MRQHTYEFTTDSGRYRSKGGSVTQAIDRFIKKYGPLPIHRITTGDAKGCIIWEKSEIPKVEVKREPVHEDNYENLDFGFKGPGISEGRPENA